jgi:hypothetical protein
VREWDISASIKNAGHYKAVFVDAPDAARSRCNGSSSSKTAGRSRKIERAQRRPGENGDKVFALTVMPTTGAAYTLRAHVRARRGKEASAHIYVLPAPTIR